MHGKDPMLEEDATRVLPASLARMMQLHQRTIRLTEPSHVRELGVFPFESCGLA